MLVGFRKTRREAKIRQKFVMCVGKEVAEGEMWLETKWILKVYNHYFSIKKKCRLEMVFCNSKRNLGNKGQTKPRSHKRLMELFNSTFSVYSH